MKLYLSEQNAKTLQSLICFALNARRNELAECLEHDEDPARTLEFIDSYERLLEEITTQFTGEGA